MNTINAIELHAAVLNSLNIKIAAHFAATGIEPNDVVKSMRGKRAINVAVCQLLIDHGRADFATWCETASVKPIMRAVNFLLGLTTLDVSLGKDKIAQALIDTARTLGKDTLPLALVHHQLIQNHETEADLSAMTGGRSIRKASRPQGKGTALSMLSNRCGKNGFLQYLGMVSRADDKSVVIDKGNPFYQLAEKLLPRQKGVNYVDVATRLFDALDADSPVTE